MATHIIPCPCCHGEGGSTIDRIDALEPASVSACHICLGLHYLNTVIFTRMMLTETGDVFEASASAACNERGEEDV